jgi:hypothetical protein
MPGHKIAVYGMWVISRLTDDRYEARHQVRETEVAATSLKDLMTVIRAVNRSNHEEVEEL